MSSLIECQVQLNALVTLSTSVATPQCPAFTSGIEHQPILGLFESSTGSFSASTFLNYVTAFLPESIGGLELPTSITTGGFTMNSGTMMGNYEMCNNMDKYLYNFYQQNTAGLNPTYCAASMSGGSLGGICIPEGCQGVGGANFTFTEFRELVVEILKSDGEISTDCQRYAVGDRISLIPSIVTDCNYIHCANEYSKNDYLTKLFHWAEMFDPQGMFQSYYIPTTVECYPTKPEYDTKTTVFIVFIFALLGVVFLSTIWSLLGRTKVREVFGGSSAKKEGRGLLDEPLLNPAEIRTTAEGFEEDEEEATVLPTPPMVVSAFCFTSNLGKIFSFKRRPGPFACFDCLRAMSALWVILGHTQLWESFYNLNSFRISAGNDSINSSFLGQVLNTESFTLSVDTFFFLSSFLAGYFILKELSKKPNLSVLRLWFSKFINRAVRIWACFAFTLFFSWLVAPTMTNGSPGVPGNAIVASCDGDGWWRALLYVGNIVPWSSRGVANCFGHTWYLAADMQLFLLLPPIVCLYWKARVRDLEDGGGETFFRKVHLTLLLLLIAGSCSWALILTLANDMSYFFNDGAAQGRYSQDYYGMPWMRFPAYYLGVVASILWFEKEVNYPDWKLSIWQRNAVVTVSGCLLFVSVYGGYAGNENAACGVYDDSSDCGSGYSDIVEALVVAFMRPCFVIGVALMSFVCFMGQGGFIADIMESKAWLPVSLTSYPMYLIHPAILTFLVTTAPSMLVFSTYQYVINYLGVVAVTFMAAVVISCIVEAPAGYLQKTYMWK